MRRRSLKLLGTRHVCVLLLLGATGPAHGISTETFESPQTRRCFIRLEELSENGSVAFDDYRQNNSRWWIQYRAQFQSSHGPDVFQRRIGTLKPGSVVVDVGSGTGMAMMQLAAAKPGVKTVAINAQDPTLLFDRLDGLGNALDKKGSRALAYEPERKGERGERLATVDGVRQRDIFGIAVASGFPVPAWLTEPLAQNADTPLATMKSDLTALAKHFREWRAKAPVEFSTGAARDKLKGRENSADVLLDVYGAYFYGADRLQLLEAYYATLKPGGTAFISLGKPEEYGGDVVTGPKLKEGRMLAAYLVGKFPDLFDLHQTPSNHWFLVLDKPEKEPPTLSIPLTLKKREDYHREANGFVVPKLTFEE